MRITLPALCLPAAIALPGCIFDDIRTELETANATLAETEQRLDEVTRANEQLEALQIRLELLESIDASLASIDGSLKSVDGTLMTLDEHLASLRETINNIDSTIPFLSISGDDTPTEETTDASAEQEMPADAPSTMPENPQ